MDIKFNDKSTYSLHPDKFTIVIEIPNLNKHDHDALRYKLIKVLDEYKKTEIPEDNW